MSEDWRAGVSEDVRSLVMEAAPGVVEEAKWRGSAFVTLVPEALAANQA